MNPLPQTCPRCDCGFVPFLSSLSHGVVCISTPPLPSSLLGNRTAGPSTLSNVISHCLLVSPLATCSTLAPRTHSPHGIQGSFDPGPHSPVSDVANAQGSKEEAQVNTGLKEVHLPGVRTHQVKLPAMSRWGDRTQNHVTEPGPHIHLPPDKLHVFYTTQSPQADSKLVPITLF
jgi:hypothetical protein